MNAAEPRTIRLFRINLIAFAFGLNLRRTVRALRAIP